MLKYVQENVPDVSILICFLIQRNYLPADSLIFISASRRM